MEDILILGSMFPPGHEEEVLKKTKSATIQTAANAHMRMVIDGIAENVGIGYTILNILPIGSYPKRYNDWYIKEYGFKYRKTENHVNVGYCNITAVKQLSKPYRLKRRAEEWARRKNGNKFFVLVYSLEPEFLNTAYILKNKFNCHVCILTADLPKFTDADKGGRFIYNFTAAYRTHNAFTKIKCADSYVFLTESMAEYFGVKDKPYTVMEGIVPKMNVSGKMYNDTGIKYVVYTGTLTRKYGVMDLVNAFLKIKKENYRLIICGSGETENEIRNINDSRVIYKGVVTHDEAKKIQSEATVLVNPRNNNEEFTKYSFPSKLMEYMLAGRPVLCFKLDGIPDEYDEYLNYFDSTDNIGTVIEQFCEMSEEQLFKIGEKAQKYVIENKNSKVQMGRVLKMMKSAECDMV